MRYLHITEKGRIGKILEEGIIPAIGENSKTALEEEPLICLCDETSLPMWMITLGRKNEDVIEVDAGDLVSEQNYSGAAEYAEYRLKERIAPSRLRRIKDPVTQEKYNAAMRRLCIDNLYNVSHLCLMCAQYYRRDEKRDPEEVEDMLALLQIQTAVLERLDYASVSQQELKEKLREHGESGYNTYDDFWHDTKYKLHQMLTRYPEDSLTAARKRFQRAINRQLKETLTMNTGEWE